MITKTYKANTNISINVVLPSKKNLHIAFVPLSNGSSVFTTDNEDIQKSVENHYKFGKLFKLHSAHGQSETAETAGKASKSGSPEKLHVEGTHSGEDTHNGEDKPDNETGRQDEMPQKDAGDNNTTSRKVKVSDIASAKDYLADTFGISRTSMRSTKAIMEQAAANGIEFEGLE